ncbi:MAG TPA: FG-GAP-like repeat-containing protein [Candidatus Binatia bacterium]|nr:FG-GAP-like repeat-containing protein [Candidatus Binatia bacterium]
MRRDAVGVRAWWVWCAVLTWVSATHAAVLYVGLTNGTSAAFTRTAGAWTRVTSADIPLASPFASPAFADLDGDGDRDALVGQEKGEVRGWRNDGTDAAPRWARAVGWDVGRFGNRSVPALADLDGDGDVDLLIGEASGAVLARENVGDRGSPSWQEHLGWDVPDAGNDSRPALGDVDGDGRPDLLVGYRSGAVLAFRHAGDAAAPFVRQPAWDPPAGSDRVTPGLGDLDGDGAEDLLLADGFARFSAYRNVGGTWVAQATWAPSDPGSGPVGVAMRPGTLDGTTPPPPPPGNTGPVARLVASPSSGAPPLVVRLDARSSSDADGDALAYAWDFGDGLVAGPVDAGVVLRGMDAAYDAAKADRDANRFTEAIDGYLAAVARLMPLTTIATTGPVTKQGTNRVDRVSRWYLQKIAHDLGAIYLFNSLGMAVCPRYALALQFSREAAAQAVAGGFPALPDANGTNANIVDATARLLASACPIPVYEPMFTTPPQSGGALVDHTYVTAGTFVARVSVSDGTSSASASVTITVGTVEPPPPPPPPDDGDALQGFGASTPGGAGGRSIPVREATEAAVRDAFERANAGGRATVVFEVTGPIEITRPLPALTAPFLTIEGGGATLYGPRVGMLAPILEILGHDVIVRDLRVRNGGDNVRVQGKGAYGIVLSHVSSTGATDDGISIGYGAHDVTVQHCFLAGNTRSIFLKYGATTNVSIHDTWIMKQWMRGPLVSQNVVVDIRNVILEDWTMWGLRFEKGASGNVVNSTFRLSAYADGIGGKSDSALRVNGRPVFTAGNVMEGRVSELDAGTLASPIPAPAVSLRTAATVEARAGTMPRDAVDQQYVAATSGWRVRGSKPFRLGPGS